ncbi:hypothetical protein CROQUDRAFT_708538 [Cronartium quercuum f. sp. fusiforme G11]|uniref:Uncharacterized protein n=1 Tax=Cronartium quercuum f. sp. fusiforme G11 TaxID=708437 RepID=A0A9P6NJJ2_9BASI|nr:hypothetical protein CROQUDRAFT_708538 [Cronartium quercuum f. sp. fusiforme G11]
MAIKSIFNLITVSLWASLQFLTVFSVESGLEECAHEIATAHQNQKSEFDSVSKLAQTSSYATLDKQDHIVGKVNEQRVFIKKITQPTEERYRTPREWLLQLLEKMNWHKNSSPYQTFFETTAPVLNELRQGRVQSLFQELLKKNPSMMKSNIFFRWKETLDLEFLEQALNEAYKLLRDPNLGYEDTLLALGIFMGLKPHLTKEGYEYLIPSHGDRYDIQVGLELAFVEDKVLKECFSRASMIAFHRDLQRHHKVVFPTELEEFIHYYFIKSTVPSSTSEGGGLHTALVSAMIHSQHYPWARYFIADMISHLQTHFPAVAKWFGDRLQEEENLQPAFHIVMAEKALQSIASSAMEEVKNILEPFKASAQEPSLEAIYDLVDTFKGSSLEKAAYDQLNSFLLAHIAIHEGVLENFIKALDRDLFIPPNLLDVWYSMHPHFQHREVVKLDYRFIAFTKYPELWDAVTRAELARFWNRSSAESQIDIEALKAWLTSSGSESQRDYQWLESMTLKDRIEFCIEAMRNLPWDSGKARSDSQGVLYETIVSEIAKPSFNGLDAHDRMYLFGCLCHILRYPKPRDILHGLMLSRLEHEIPLKNNLLALIAERKTAPFPGAKTLGMDEIILLMEVWCRDLANYADANRAQGLLNILKVASSMNEKEQEQAMQ